MKAVKRLELTGTDLVYLPPESGEMACLEDIDTYTSYRLHWYPYEITRCPRLGKSTVSTRALYGNRKYRPPFPQLPSLSPAWLPKTCSVCDGPLIDPAPHQVWISLPVATDVLPLLVHACSETCVARLPTPPEGYVDRPHRGGQALRQPPRGFEVWRHGRPRFQSQ